MANRVSEWISTAANILQLVLPPGGALLVWSAIVGAFNNFLAAPWYVHVGFIAGCTILFWFLCWLYFPVAIKWRLKKMSLIQTRATLPPFADELAEADRAYAFWFNGGDVDHEKIYERTHKPNKLVILDPESPSLPYHVRLYGQPLDSFQTITRDSKESAEKAGIEVKTWNQPLPFSFTIFNPDSASGRIRLEFPIPGAPRGRRPSVTIYRKTDPDIYSDLVKFFERAFAGN